MKKLILGLVSLVILISCSIGDNSSTENKKLMYLDSTSSGSRVYELVNGGWMIDAYIIESRNGSVSITKP